MSLDFGLHRCNGFEIADNSCLAVGVVNVECERILFISAVNASVCKFVLRQPAFDGDDAAIRNGIPPCFLDRVCKVSPHIFTMIVFRFLWVGVWHGFILAITMQSVKQVRKSGGKYHLSPDTVHPKQLNWI